MQTNEIRVPPPPPNMLVCNNDGRATTTSLIIAQGTQVQHKNVIGLTRTYLSDLEEFGRVAFQTRPFDTAGGVQTQEFAHFNERQATLLMTYMKNTPIIREFKKQLVRAFYQLAEQPMSKAQHILAMAQKMVDHEARINHNEERINHVAIEQSQMGIKQENQQQQIDCVSQRQDAMDGDTGYRTVLAFCRMKHFAVPLDFAQKLGRRASKECRRLNLEKGNVSDERHGSVGSYPITILEECFAFLKNPTTINTGAIYEKSVKPSPLAEELGLTEEELSLLTYEIDTNESNDGLIYDYILTFEKDDPREILDKISKLSHENVVRVSVGAFNEPDYSEV